MENLDKVYAEKVAEEYAPKSTTKVVQLKKLDAMVKRPAKIFGYTLGALSVMVFGAGFSMYMTNWGPSGDLGTYLSYGLMGVGLFACIANIFISRAILNSRKKKYAFDILELAKEISENE